MPRFKLVDDYLLTEVGHCDFTVTLLLMYTCIPWITC